jgi:hypothetical protein
MALTACLSWIDWALETVQVNRSKGINAFFIFVEIMGYPEKQDTKNPDSG